MTPVYKNMPQVDIPEHSICDKCGHRYTLGNFAIRHSDVCDYLWFRDVEAPKIGWSSVHWIYDNYYLETVFKIHNIPYKLFKLDNLGFGRFSDLFASEDIICLINLYHSKEGYAGMGLEEFIVSITGSS
jgi:hypothetical protein